MHPTKHSYFLLAICTTLLTLTMAACEQTGGDWLPGSRLACESNHEVNGWAVTAALSRTHSQDVIINQWSAQRQFSTFFGVGIIFDTSYNPTPYLEISHDYKTGDFAMRLPDNTQLSFRLNANFAVTTANLRPVDIGVLRTQAVRIEHTAHDGKWRTYQTDGLPEAIAAAETELALLKTKSNDRECSI